MALYESPILPIISHMATESCGLCRLPPLRLLSLASTGMTTLTSHTTTRLTTASSADMHTRPRLEATPSSSAARSLRPVLRTCTSTPLLVARKCSRLPTGSSYNPTTACLWPSTGYVLQLTMHCICTSYQEWPRAHQHCLWQCLHGLHCK